MNQVTQEAIDRVKKALEATKPRNALIVDTETAEGKPIYSETTPVVQVFVSDVLAIIDTLRSDKYTDTVKMLRRGSRAIQPGRLAHYQTQDLWHLLSLVGLKPPPETSEPAPPATKPPEE